MSTIKRLFSGQGTAITCTLASLVAAAFRQSTVIDNTSNLFLDALVMLKIKTGSGGPTGQKAVNVYAYGTVDGGTSYTDGASGSDGSMTPTSPTNLRLLGVLNCPAATTTYTGGPWSVAAAFGGVLPEKWGLVIENQTGQTLDATEGNHAKLFEGVQASVV